MSSEAGASNNGQAVAVTGPLETFRGLFKRPDLVSSLAMVAPKHLTPDRITKIALAAMSRNPKLLECTQASILKAIMAAAELGLEPGGILGHAYLVPFWNSKAGGGRGAFECVLITGYKGKVELARRSGVVSSIVARAVYEKDTLTWEYGLNEQLVHKPFTGAGEPGKLTHVYAVAVLKDGTKIFDVMAAAQVEEIHHRSQGYKTAKAKGWTENSPWVTDPVEMAKKTVVHRLSKYLPLAPDKPEHAGFLKAQIAEERAESGAWTGNVYGIDPEEDEGVVQGTAERVGGDSPLDQAAADLKGAGLATGDGPNPGGPKPAEGDPAVDQDKLLDELTRYLLGLTEFATAQGFAHKHRAEILKLDAKHRELFAIALKAHQEHLRASQGQAKDEEKPKRGKKAKADEPAAGVAASGAGLATGDGPNPGGPKPATPAPDGLLPNQCGACYSIGSHQPGCPEGES